MNTHKPLPDAAEGNREADSHVDAGSRTLPSDAVRDFAAPSNGADDPQPTPSRRERAAMTPQERREVLLDLGAENATYAIERWIAEAHADERRNTAERIAQAIEAAADEHNRRIARIANVPYDPDRRDGMTAGGIRQAARIACEAGGGQ